MNEPIDHLANKSGNTVELLAQLTDAELDEQIAFYRQREDWYRSTPTPDAVTSVYRSHSYAAYRYGSWVGMAETVRRVRLRESGRLEPGVEDRTTEPRSPAEG